MNKQQKEQNVEEIRQALAGAQAVVAADSATLTANQQADLRRKLRKEGVHYLVAKNTLLRIATAGTHLESMHSKLVGPTGIAWHPTEVSVAAKVMLAWAKESDKLVLKAGVLNGTLLDKAGIEALSKMPGKDELRSTLLSLFQAVPTKFVRTLVAGQQSFLNVLGARKTALGETV